MISAPLVQHKKVKVAHTRLPSIPELIPVVGSQTAGNVSHKPGGRLPLLSTRPAVTLATLQISKREITKKRTQHREYLEYER